MIEDIRRLLAARPFEPFTLSFVDGGKVHVPTVNHIHVPPAGNRVFVHDDNGDHDVVRPLLISRLTVDGGQQPANPSA